MGRLLRILSGATVVLAVLAAAHYYVWSRLTLGATPGSAWPPVAGAAMATLTAVLVLGALGAHAGPRRLRAPLAWVSFSWMGLFWILLVLAAASDVARGTLALVRSLAGADRLPGEAALSSPASGAALVAASVIVALLGVASARGRVRVRTVRAVLPRLGENRLRVAQISDLHLGPSLGRTFLDGVVDDINALTPDVVAITGDLVDGRVEDLREAVAPLARLEARHGVYFVTGNHEFYAGAGAWLAHLPTLGVRVLANERVAAGPVDLAGTHDPAGASLGPSHGEDLDAALRDRDPSRAVILLAHQPRTIWSAARLDVDLQLSGHTHGGQIFPWGWFVRLQQGRFIAGLHRVGRSLLYVSRGTGYWGPPMRILAPAEITFLELSGEGASSP